MISIIVGQKKNSRKVDCEDCEVREDCEDCEANRFESSRVGVCIV